MVRFLLLVILVGGTFLTAHSQTPAPGVVHDSVVVTADPTNSYALYLPSAYSASKQWPLLLAFDPFARGAVAVKLFHEAAEKYGFIVIGSNNSRNFGDPSNAIRLLAADVKARYSVDARRIYLTGLSGGARVASSMALACKTCIAGVIANSAGMPASGGSPSPDGPDWFLLAGTTDFNYPEMVRLKETLDNTHIVSRFVVFEGPHNWMPKDFAEQALAWLQLRAMVRGVMPVDKVFVSKQFDERVAETQAAEKNNDLLAAVRDYREIVTDFKAFRDVKGQEAQAKSLGDSGAYRKARKNEKAALDLQDEVTMKIGSLTEGIAERPDALTQLLEQLESAVKDQMHDEKQSSNPERKNAIARGLAAAFAYTTESGEKAMLKNDFTSARANFLASEIILPDSAWASYLVATAYAELGDKKDTLQELKKALDKGLTNPKALDDNAFDRIRNEEAFKQIAAKLATAPDNETAK